MITPGNAKAVLKAATTDATGPIARPALTGPKGATALKEAALKANGATALIVLPGPTVPPVLTAAIGPRDRNVLIAAAAPPVLTALIALTGANVAP